jgi:hypothetical protein
VIDQTVTITGVELNQYRIVAKTATTGGTISPAGTFMVTHGDSKTFEITPDENYNIQDVVVNGESQGAITFYTLSNVTADATIEAHFEYCVGIIENSELQINVFSYGNVVTIVNETLIPINSVEIMDITGRMVWRGQALDMKTEITLHVASGVYAVRIISDQKQQITKVSIN